MVMNRAQFKRQLQWGLNTVFGLEYKDYSPEWSQIFDVEQSEKAYEEDLLSIGLGNAPVKSEGAAVAYDGGQEGWVARYTHQTIALAFAITEEAEEDGLYGKLGARYAKMLARSLMSTKEIIGANILNNAFSSSYLGGDGVSLLSTAHPLAGGGTFANKLATPADLAEASIEDMLIQISKITDDRGIIINLDGAKLIIPTDLTYVAQRILRSDMRSGTSDNDLNALKSLGKLKGGIVVNHRLTDTDAWFVKSTAQDGLKHFNRKGVSRGIEGDFETGNMRYKARERYSFGWSDPRGLFGSEGA